MSDAKIKSQFDPVFLFLLQSRFEYYFEMVSIRIKHPLHNNLGNNLIEVKENVLAKLEFAH